MDNERAENLLDQISAWDSEALKALFDEAAPSMAARLAYDGVPAGAAETAIVQVFADIWDGEYSVPMRPGQSLPDWLATLAQHHVRKTKQATPQQPVPITAALWKRVEASAFPSGWRDFLKRSDVLFAIIAAVAWALILRFVVN